MEINFESINRRLLNLYHGQEIQRTRDEYRERFYIEEYEESLESVAKEVLEEKLGLTKGKVVERSVKKEIKRELANSNIEQLKKMLPTDEELRALTVLRDHQRTSSVELRKAMETYKISEEMINNLRRKGLIELPSKKEMTFLDKLPKVEIDSSIMLKIAIKNGLKEVEILDLRNRGFVGYLKENEVKFIKESSVQSNKDRLSFKQAMKYGINSSEYRYIKSHLFTKELAFGECKTIPELSEHVAADKHKILPVKNRDYLTLGDKLYLNEDDKFNYNASLKASVVIRYSEKHETSVALNRNIKYSANSKNIKQIIDADEYVPLMIHEKDRAILLSIPDKFLSDKQLEQKARVIEKISNYDVDTLLTSPEDISEDRLREMKKARIADYLSMEEIECLMKSSGDSLSYAKKNGYLSGKDVSNPINRFIEEKIESLETKEDFIREILKEDTSLTFEEAEKMLQGASYIFLTDQERMELNSLSRGKLAFHQVADRLHDRIECLVKINSSIVAQLGIADIMKNSGININALYKSKDAKLSIESFLKGSLSKNAIKTIIDTLEPVYSINYSPTYNSSQRKVTVRDSFVINREFIESIKASQIKDMSLTVRDLNRIANLIKYPKQELSRSDCISLCKLQTITNLESTLSNIMPNLLEVDFLNRLNGRKYDESKIGDILDAERIDYERWAHFVESGIVKIKSDISTDKQTIIYRSLENRSLSEIRVGVLSENNSIYDNLRLEEFCKVIRSLQGDVEVKPRLSEFPVLYKIKNGISLNSYELQISKNVLIKGYYENSTRLKEITSEYSKSFKIRGMQRYFNNLYFAKNNMINIGSLEYINTFKQVTKNQLIKAGLSEEEIHQYVTGIRDGETLGKVLTERVLPSKNGEIRYYSLNIGKHIDGKSILKLKLSDKDISTHPQRRQDLLFHDLKVVDAVQDAVERLKERGFEIMEVKNESSQFSSDRKGIQNDERLNLPTIMDAVIVARDPNGEVRTFGVEYGNYSIDRMRKKLDGANFDEGFVYSNGTYKNRYTKAFGDRSNVSFYNI